jgi:hypothetical protein
MRRRQMINVRRTRNGRDELRGLQKGKGKAKNVF